MFWINLQKVNNLTSSLYAIGTNLSRSASSVGERQSNAYVSPILPKRAETFGGFDNAASCKGFVSVVNFKTCACVNRSMYFKLKFCVGFVAGFGRKLSQQFQKKSSSDFQDNKSQSPSLPSSPVGTPELGSRKSVILFPTLFLNSSLASRVVWVIVDELGISFNPWSFSREGLNHRFLDWKREIHQKPQDTGHTNTLQASLTHILWFMNNMVIVWKTNVNLLCKSFL